MVNVLATPPAKPAPHEPLERGVRFIVLYKLVKAVLMLLAAIAMWAGLKVGVATWLARVALDVGPHAVSPWIARLCGKAGSVRSTTQDNAVDPSPRCLTFQPNTRL